MSDSETTRGNETTKDGGESGDEQKECETSNCLRRI